eukprot:COSAG02_NODE_44519_length_365_cov_1.120301_1_plen_82_part_10
MDACQTVGQLEIDVHAIGCDFLSATGRKYLRGPRGSGFLYCSDKLLAAGIAPPMIDRAQQLRKHTASYSLSVLIIMTIYGFV